MGGGRGQEKGWDREGQVGKSASKSARRGVWSCQKRSSHPTLSPVQRHDAIVMVAGRQQHRGVLPLSTLHTVGG